MSKKVSKCVIPVAGLGTRFLPITKAVPKELLPIIDKPILHYIINEAIVAGIETIILVSSAGKTTIEDYFDLGNIHSYKIQSKKKEHLIESVKELNKKVDIVSIRQDQQLGLGHAVYQANNLISSEESFGVLLGDEIIESDSPQQSALKSCLDLMNNSNEDIKNVIGVLEVPKEETEKYGIVSLESNEQMSSNGFSPITGFVEKPTPQEAPSNWAIPGRYVFNYDIFDVIKNTPKGKGSEIQLTDAMDSLLKKQSFYAQKMTGKRFDTGSKLGYLQANVYFALKNKELKDDLRNFIQDIL